MSLSKTCDECGDTKSRESPDRVETKTEYVDGEPNFQSLCAGCDPDREAEFEHSGGDTN